MLELAWIKGLLINRGSASAWGRLFCMYDIQQTLTPPLFCSKGRNSLASLVCTQQLSFCVPCGLTHLLLVDQAAL
jgi:hypothetical protein